MNPTSPGGGARFQAMVASGKSPALAAYIGRKKYGKTQFQQLAAKGRKRRHKKGPPSQPPQLLAQALTRQKP